VRGISAIEEDLMNKKNITDGKWQELRRQVKAWWGQLSDSDLDQIQGRYEPLIGKLQERYGYTRQEAESEIQKFLMQANITLEKQR
jgi:uncharacterized protein YjbJ (UPF0337 family)